MRAMNSVLAAVLILTAGIAQAAGPTATVSWTPPTQNEDGSALTNLAGYTIRWYRAGAQRGTATAGVAATSKSVNFVCGKVTVGITARNSAGGESVESALVTYDTGVACPIVPVSVTGVSIQ